MNRHEITVSRCSRCPFYLESEWNDDECGHPTLEDNMLLENIHLIPKDCKLRECEVLVKLV